MTETIQAADENHYQWGGVCDGWHLVRGGDLSVIEEQMPPGSEEQRHFHQRARQFFYVLEGELAMEVEGRFYVLKARHGLEIAPGAPHQARNSSQSEVRFLVVSQPPSQGDRQPA